MRPELSGQLLNTGISNVELHVAVERAMELLRQQMGIDLPDGIAGMLPYIGEVVLGVKLIMDIISTERDLNELDIQDRSRVHALKALMLMSRFGISSVCVAIGGAAGGPAGPAGIAVGSLSGAGLAFYLSRRLRPRMVEIAAKLAGVTEDDIFYYRNKLAIDELGLSFANTKFE